MMLMMSYVLAVGSGMSVGDIGALVAAILVGLGCGGVGTAKLMEKRMRISTDDEGLRMAKDYITRTEHEVFRAEVRADFLRLEAISQRVFDRVDTKHLELIQTIERAAKSGLDGRVALWDEVKAQGKSIAGLRENVNVSRDLAAALERLAKEVTRG